MKYSINEVEGQGYVLIKVTGNVTRQEMIACDVEAHALGRKLGIRRYLMDLTDAVNVESVTDNYRFVHIDVDRDDIDRLARVAMLVAPEDHSHDFIETAGANAGRFVKLFRDWEQAVSYLKD